MDDPIRSLRRRAHVTQSALADAAQTSQPTIAAYEAGRKSPTLDTLRRLAASVDLQASVTFHPPMTREESRSLALHEAIAERLASDPSGGIERARRNLRRMREGPARNSPFLREWRVLLDRPVQDLIPLLLDPSPWARELRHVTPFAGMLTAAERASVYRDFSEGERRR
jgi:transcriptional regulator with XRE-family HTH domain